VEWSKTKSILIIGLILTNSILALYLFSSDSLFSKGDISEDQSLKEVISILEKNNIYINMDSVNYYRIIQDLELEYENYDLEKLGRKVITEDYTSDGNKIYTRSKSIEIVSDTELLYRNNFETLDEKRLDLKDAESLASRFVSMIGFGSDDKYVFSTSIEDDTISIVYKQNYNGFFLEDTYMTVTIKGNNISEFRRKWFKINNVYDNNRRVIAPSKALFLFMEKFEDMDEKIVITDISFGYKLDTGVINSNVASGDAFPYWRIRTESDKIYFIEAVEK
jgi:regulatory protein YycI of two-component signal transduction system YycFG